MGDGAFRIKPAPALVAPDERRIGNEEEEGHPVTNARSHWRAIEPNSEFVDEQPVQKHVEWRRDEKNIGLDSSPYPFVGFGSSAVDSVIGVEGLDVDVKVGERDVSTMS
ncbi:hypothetical protein O1611_g10251 [Lasiodiplodia mahajangana]|uniref:Uncharacterized protein n=1 Tax=Lasiodiplodia mahajangana TaxID=1108764 RepID=A0ACC2J0A4_9PEZI|nr:hypothetical protein O1611_g10251 [Lasiodiplodia mahajangana]